MIDILIPTCNQYIKYIEALQLSCELFYWPKKYNFIILGYEPPRFKLNENFSFHQLAPTQRGAEFWADDMIHFLKHYDKNHFVYANDDCALTYFDHDLFLKAVNVATQNHVGRFALMDEGKHLKKELIGTIEGTQFYNFDKDNDYRISLGWSIYNKEFFLEFCKYNMDPWAFEKSSCGIVKKSVTDKWQVLTFSPKFVIDAAFFARKNQPSPIENWHKGYYGHDIEGNYKQEVEKIIFK